METLKVTTESKSYPVHVGQGIITRLLSCIDETNVKPNKLFIITDDTVAKLYLRQILNIIGQKYELGHKVIPSGEAAKSFDNYFDCHTELLTFGLDRSSLLIALGGGVVGDLAGFVAATFMRGIPFIQIPTTLLAHDSAVGGKVAINHPLGKNMIGSFYQPEAVLYDIDFLSSLPEIEKRSGYAEVIKHALIHDATFFEWLVLNVNTIGELKDEKLIYAIISGIKVKSEIVSSDEKESGVRAFLNFGHTLGHAIEAELGYGNITHGDAVAIGMLFALYVSEERYDIDLQIPKITSLMTSIGFPTEIPSKLSLDGLIKRMKNDKKSVTGMVRFVLLKEIGTPAIEPIEDETLRALLSKFMKGE
ncbi:3-dehydroquinate synthase [Bacillus sp. SM2101]|uniref:3-dehydroquinate synthase n=1 Tax=Bacillus sp. SM2101 TaxID=2805366 RepID=UPI001BDE4F95|nr:3-dehydroquinate synthase [Bacillus sp. SM2101]